MSDKPLLHPIAGGSYVRNADGSLTQTEASTLPPHGKSQLEAASKKAESKKTPAKSEG